MGLISRVSSRTYRDLPPGPESQISTMADLWTAIGMKEPLLERITEAGYETPTPIQKKTIPLILQGKDLIAMARTGSGKTAAFLLPMIQKLTQTDRKITAVKPGDSVRALIVSPTRELALQTLKFTQQFAPQLKCCSIIGGESMADQFSQMHSKTTDILVAVPGRLMHILTEMGLEKLINVEYLVFDEADRLFEQNFQIQLQEILSRCKSDNRQTLLFSATMPPKIAEFASAGLHSPEVVRLDVEHKLPEQITLEFLYTRPEAKYAMLLYLFRQVIETEDTDEQTIVFTATKYHVEYIHKLLLELNIKSTYLFSNLNQQQRLENMQKFRDKEVSVLICTDVAARGVDVPELDNVIHFHFPANGKTFVHRCGRVCRAGRSDGRAISIISSEEIPYVVSVAKHVNKGAALVDNAYRLTQDELNVHLASVDKVATMNADVKYLKGLARKSEKQYYKTRPSAPSSCLRDSKILLSKYDGGGLPIYHECEISADDQTRVDMIDAIKNYRGKTTIFEVNTTKSTLRKAKVMENQRRKQQKTMENLKTAGYDPKDIEHQPEFLLSQANQDQPSKDADSTGLLLTSHQKDDDMTKMLKKRAGVKEKVAKRWDGKKYVRVDAGNQKYIKTGSGQRVKASFKQNAYEKWKKHQQIDHTQGEFSERSQEFNKFKAGMKRTHDKTAKNEIKNREQVAKFRKIKAKKHEKMQYDKKRNEQRVKNRKKNSKK